MNKKNYIYEKTGLVNKLEPYACKQYIRNGLVIGAIRISCINAIYNEGIGINYLQEPNTDHYNILTVTVKGGNLKCGINIMI
jgi:hypothetical protein